MIESYCRSQHQSKRAGCAPNIVAPPAVMSSSIWCYHFPIDLTVWSEFWTCAFSGGPRTCSQVGQAGGHRAVQELCQELEGAYSPLDEKSHALIFYFFWSGARSGSCDGRLVTPVLTISYEGIGHPVATFMPIFSAFCDNPHCTPMSDLQDAIDIGLALDWV